MAHTKRGSPGRPGFSLMELLMIVLVTSLMAGVMVPVAGAVQQRMSLTNAKNAIVFLGARARSHAANRGAIVMLEIDPEADAASVQFGGDTITGGLVDFQREHGADVQIIDPETGGEATIGATGILRICYSPRGYAQPGCASVPFLPLRIVFTRGAKADSVVIQPLGQIEVFE